jgi:hypothetical protein
MTEITPKTFFVNTYDNIDEKTITKEQIETYKSIDNKIIENISNILISYGSRLEKYLLEKNSKKIINIDTSLTYFSSIKKYEDYDSNFFINKDWCWMSHIFDQSLLHLFDTVKLYQCTDDKKIWPLICRFNVKSCRIIESEKNNYNIFEDIIEKEILDKIKTVLPDFELGYNKYILNVLEIMNTFLSEDNKIYGYTNYDDQAETALINFKNIIIKDSVKISHIKKYKVNSSGNEYIFPLLKSEYYKLYDGRKSFYDEYNGRRRMVLNEDAQIEIEYENFDDKSKIEIYKAKPYEEYFKEKYLKYKSKYLFLKQYI